MSVAGYHGIESGVSTLVRERGRTIGWRDAEAAPSGAAAAAHRLRSKGKLDQHEEGYCEGVEAYFRKEASRAKEIQPC